MSAQTASNTNGMTLSLLGKTIAVTGGSAGIGLEIGKALALAGADVVLVGRRADVLWDAACGIQALGGSARTLAVDIGDIDGFRAALAQVGALHGLVNNAGTNIPEPLRDVTEAHFDTMFGLNVKAAYFATQCAVNQMGGAGFIINISSQMGHVGAPDRSVYCATKHAVEGMTKALAVELASRNIRVNSICPTYIETPMTAPMLADPEFRQRTIAKIPLGRLGTPGDVAAAAVFLASDAAAMITGTSLLIDGGWTAQ